MKSSVTLFNIGSIRHVPDEYGGQFCSSSSSPLASVRELDPVLRLRISTFPSRLTGFVAEN